MMSCRLVGALKRGQNFRQLSVLSVYAQPSSHITANLRRSALVSTHVATGRFLLSTTRAFSSTLDNTNRSSSTLVLSADKSRNLSRQPSKTERGLNGGIPLDLLGLKSFLHDVLQKMDDPPVRQLQPREEHYAIADCTLAGNKDDATTFGRDEAEDDATTFLQSPIGEKRMIAAVWAPPGGGKAHMIHRVGKLAEDEGYKAIVITFGFGQKFSEYEEKVKPPPLASLCARIIFSAFEFGSYREWFNFSECYFGDPRHSGVQDAATVLKLYRQIAQYDEPDSHIFIGVDELVALQRANIFPGHSATKAESGRKRALDVYNEVVKLVDMDVRMRILFSTLDGEPIRTGIFGEVETSSSDPKTVRRANRVVMWLMLDPFSDANQGIEQVIKHWQSFGLNEQMKEAKLRWLVGVCGGHPRSLDFAGQALESLNSHEENAQSLAIVFEKTVNTMNSINATTTAPAVSVFTEVLAHCVLSRPVDISTKFGNVGEQWTSTDLIKHGWLLNAVMCQSNFLFVPKLSLLMGYRFAEPRQNEFTECKLLFDIISHGSQGSWEAFEHLHARMELLRRLAYRRLNSISQDVTIYDWYKDAIILRPDGSESHPPKLGLGSERNDYAGIWHSMKHHIEEEGAQLPTWTKGMMLAMYRNQAGCDGCLMVENSCGTRILVVTESRFSNDPKEHLTFAEVHEKISIFRDYALPILLKRYEIKEENVFYVVAALRNISESFASDLMATPASFDDSAPMTEVLEKKAFIDLQQFKGTLVVASRPVLPKFYGPTFAQCGGLAASDEQVV